MTDIGITRETQLEIASYFKVGDKIILNDGSEDIITEIRDYGYYPISTKDWVHVCPSSIKNIPQKYYENHPELYSKELTIFDYMDV